MDRSDDLPHTSSRRPARRTDLPSPFFVPSRRHRDYTGAGEGDRNIERRDRRGPSLLSLSCDGFTRSLPFVSLFMKSRESSGEESEGRKQDGRRLRARAIPVGPAELIKTSGIMREWAPRAYGEDFAARIVSRDTCFSISKGLIGNNWQ